MDSTQRIVESPSSDAQTFPSIGLKITEKLAEVKPTGETPNRWEPVWKNDLLREAILEFLSLEDLLNCSLVSNEWKGWCRSFIWKRRVCCFRIPYTHPCISLKEFGDFMATSVGTTGSGGPNHHNHHHFPFNGLKVSFASNRSPHHLRDGCCISWDQLREHASSIFSHLQLRFIFVSNTHWDSNEDMFSCEGARIVWELILHNAATLEEVDLSNFLALFPTSQIVSRAREGLFQHLRILRFGHSRTIEQQNREDLRETLKSFPAHTEIQPYRINVATIDLIPHNKWQFIRELSLDSNLKDHLLYQRFLQNDLSPLSLHSLQVHFNDVYILLGRLHPNAEIPFWRSLHKILTYSSATIQALHTAVDTLARFTNHPHFPFQPLKKLKKLNIECCGLYRGEADDGMPFPPSRNLWDINWNNFPTLHRVEIYIEEISSRYVEEILESTVPLCRQPCLSVRQLSLSFPEGKVLKLLEAVFPSVKTLELEFFYHDDFGQCWTSWPQLEELILTVDATDLWAPDYEGNVPEAGIADFHFCGISQEEARFLRSSESEVLQNLHIVRIGPSVTDLKHLKSITVNLRYSPKLNMDLGLTACLPGFITRLTGFLAFNRMLRLRVAFALDSDDNTPREQDLLELPCVKVEDR